MWLPGYIIYAVYLAVLQTCGYLFATKTTTHYNDTEIIRYNSGFYLFSPIFIFHLENVVKLFGSLSFLCASDSTSTSLHNFEILILSDRLRISLRLFTF